MAMNTRAAQCVLGDDIAAIIFGVGGVVIDNARTSAAAWKSVLDPFLRSYATTEQREFRPFQVHDDYLWYMDARPRLDGLRDFLSSRGLSLPYQDLRGLAGRQERLFLTEVRRHGIAPFASTVAFVRTTRRHGIRTAAVSVDWYATEVLTRAGVIDMFDVRLDGLDAPGTGLPTRLQPRLLLEAAQRLGTPPARTAVVAQSLAGVSSGRHAGFGVVVGVDRGGQAAALRENGADMVINDLSEMRLPAKHAMAGRSWRRG
jgi:beta-phosphoglucomutase-like phosphatase (HAD superfamily)